jgi:RNA ligase (TIGR02306 family)
MRKLASIQIVNAVEPIPNADAIERVRVLGWWVVCKKGELQPGDRVVYCEIDSLLPEKPEYEFLRQSCFKAALEQGGLVTQRAGFRIKTVKMRGQVSQGICFPMSILPPGTPTEVGTVVTEALGIIKYDPPLPIGMSGRVKGGFPDFIPKTDEIRVQVLERVLERHRGKTFHVTEKLDGTSFTAFLRDGSFGLCSRNLHLDETDESHLFVQLAKRLDLTAMLTQLRDRYRFAPAIQAEVIGPGIQGNKYGLKAVELHVFNLFDMDAQRLIDHTRALDILREVGLTTVPQIGEIVLAHTVDELIAMSVGRSMLNQFVQREGIVLRPPAEEYDEDVGGRLSFKAINPQFLLMYDE